MLMNDYDISAIYSNIIKMYPELTNDTYQQAFRLAVSYNLISRSIYEAAEVYYGKLWRLREKIIYGDCRKKI